MEVQEMKLMKEYVGIEMNDMYVLDMKWVTEYVGIGRSTANYIPTFFILKENNVMFLQIKCISTSTEIHTHNFSVYQILFGFQIDQNLSG
jgi:hypothetical protein